MRTSIRRTALATTAVLGLAIVGLGGAAAAAGPAGAGNPTIVHASSPPSGQGAASPSTGHNQVAHIEQRIIDLRTKLQITPAQSGQWDQVAQVMRDNAASIDAAFDQRVKALPGMTAPENLQSYEALATEHAQEAQKLVPAFQVLYDTMSDSQRHRADQVFRDDAGRHEPARHG